MVKSARRNHNRRGNNTSASKIARLSTGVPITKRRVQADPPMLPNSMSFTPRVRFMIHRILSSTNTGYKITLPSLPTGIGLVALYANPMDLSGQTSFALTFNEIFASAAMRIYGVDVTASLDGANYLHTEYAIQKIVLYGAAQRETQPTWIRLAADVGGTPGFVGTDSGATNRRAVVCCSFPRLSWHRIASSSEFGTVGGAFSTPQNLPWIKDKLPGSIMHELGVLDFSIVMRRSVHFPISETKLKRTVVFDTDSTLLAALP